MGDVELVCQVAQLLATANIQEVLNVLWVGRPQPCRNPTEVFETCGEDRGSIVGAGNWTRHQSFPMCVVHESWHSALPTPSKP